VEGGGVVLALPVGVVVGLEFDTGIGVAPIAGLTFRSAFGSAYTLPPT
jgi:hypothetical protein